MKTKSWKQIENKLFTREEIAGAERFAERLISPNKRPRLAFCGGGGTVRMQLTKAQSRQRWSELRDLVVEWDPLLFQSQLLACWRAYVLWAASSRFCSGTSLEDL